jgi:transposase
MNGSNPAGGVTSIPGLKKACSEQAALIHEDEASFRQDSTLHQTWSRRGCQLLIPVIGARRSLKVFGSVEIYSARFLYKLAEAFTAETYLTYLERLARAYFPRRTYLIQDNASYHKDREVGAWFNDNRHWLTVYHLPPYSPEFNATERLWHHTRITGTHNRYFVTPAELEDVVIRVFKSIQHAPEQIHGYLHPFR